MRHDEELDAEEARVVFDVLDDHLGLAQRVRGLKFIARICHLGDERLDPGVQLQLQHAPILGGAYVLALNQLQVVGDA